MFLELGQIVFGRGIVDVGCFINKYARNFQVRDTRACWPCRVLLDVTENRFQITLGPGGVYVANNLNVRMTCQSRYLALVVRIRQIIKSRTIERINDYGE
jgi:hypothetical protein